MSVDGENGHGTPLTDEEQDLFERLAEKYEGDEKMERICDLVLAGDHSEDDDSSEEANA